MLGELVEDIRDFNIQNSISNQQDAKLIAAEKAFDAGQEGSYQVSIDALDELINTAEGEQLEGKIPKEDFVGLTDAALQIIKSLQ